VTVPLVMVVGLLLGGAGSGNPSQHPSQRAPLRAVTVSAPAETDAATVDECARVISALPLTLAGQNVRGTISTPTSPSIRAWGDPAIVLRCGVARPRQLTSALLQQFIAVDGVLFLPDHRAKSTLWTVVDRAAYLDVDVPESYPQPPLAPIADVIAQVAPPVCTVPDSSGATPVPNSKLCTRRK
jgi:hypothetical protein